MLEGSNIIIKSNVYVVSSDLRNDTELRARVRGRENLHKMVTRLFGPGHEEHYRKYLTSLQIQEWELGMYCTRQDDKDDLVWGIVEKNEMKSFECRCYHYQCKGFDHCRPGFEPGKSPSVIVRTKNWQQEAKGVKEPALKGEEPTTLHRYIGEKKDKDAPQDNGPIVIDFGTDEDIPGYIKTPMCEPEIIEATDAPVLGQADIIRAEPREHLMVLAGPGTGKTYCLIEKLKVLLEESNTLEANSILVLCFTRAAVREIRDRLRSEIETGNYSDDFSRLQIWTFDSFATRVLLKVNEDVSDRGYDDRILMAVDEVRGDIDILMDVRHFIVDEIQDLVGVRAHLVQTILECLPEECGFTLFGDPLQGIYDYQIKDETGELSASGLIDWVRQCFSASLTNVELTENRRQSGNLSDSLIQSRRLIESGGDRDVEDFFNHVRNIKTCGPEHKFKIPPGENQRVAILCRNNGEVLKISNYLRLWRIGHAVRRDARTQPLLPVWVADLLGGDTNAITRDLLGQVNNKGGYWSTEDTDRIFYVLEGLTPARRGVLGCDKVRHALALGERLPDEIYEETKERICISTIHQSKGREYDTVLFLRPDKIQGDIFEEAKNYYVALTRAKSKLFAIDKKGGGTYLAANVSDNGRWIEMACKKGGKRKLVSFEIGLEHDVDVQSFVDGDILHDPVENQQFIREMLEVGQAIELRKIDVDKGHYGIFLEKRMLGRMSDDFISNIRSVMKGVYGKFQHIPWCFEEVYVNRIYSIVRKPETVRNSVAEPWADTGVWYAVDVKGLGLVRWDFD